MVPGSPIRCTRPVDSAETMDIHVNDSMNSLNPRMVMFDACYNSSIPFDDCIATSYILPDPETASSPEGNSVSTPCRTSGPTVTHIGLLDCGVRIGNRWGHNGAHYLKRTRSRDPPIVSSTGRCPAPNRTRRSRQGCGANKYWLRMAARRMPADVQAIAISRKLADNGYTAGRPTCAKNALPESPYGSVRLKPPHTDEQQPFTAARRCWHKRRATATNYCAVWCHRWISDCGDDELVPRLSRCCWTTNFRAARDSIMPAKGMMFIVPTP